jgi:hypothetical protein
MTASFSSTPYAPSELVNGNAHLLVSRQITLKSGQSLSRGAVLGAITDESKYILSLAAATDGSQTPDLILAEDCNASSADKVTLAYARGDFNTSALTLGTGHTVASIREGLRTKGITLVSILPA